MTEHILIGLALIIVLGVASHWLAWRLGLPSIFLLLIVGFMAGPVSGLIDPKALLSGLFFPIVSFSVAIILFEGGLHLRIEDLRAIGKVVRNLVTLGALVAWIVAAEAAHLILGLDHDLAMLLGAILVVSGPTVIIPLIRHVRPKGHTGRILRWEGTLIDPIGAMLAVLVFEAIATGRMEAAATVALMGLVKTIVLGSLVGLIGARIMIFMLKHYLIPDYLQNPITLVMVIGVYTASNYFQIESGLLASTVMGVALANQKSVAVRHIIEFKESIRVLLIANLFIILAASMTFSDLEILNTSSIAFLAVLMFVGRPLSVFLSTPGAGLGFREKLFLSWVAPRGIVAAAVASIFSIRLIEMGHAQAQIFVPMTFFIIISTVAIYSLTAGPVAAWLKLSDPHPQGVLIVGANPLGRAIAKALANLKLKVKLVDTNWTNISQARLEGISTYYGSVLADYAMEEIELNGIGRLMALTSNDEVNSLAALHYAKLFGRAEVYQLPYSGRAVSDHMRGRTLFTEKFTKEHFLDRLEAGASIKKIKLTEEFDFRTFTLIYGKDAVPLFLMNETGILTVFTADREISPKSGQTLLALVDPKREIRAQSEHSNL